MHWLLSKCVLECSQRTLALTDIGNAEKVQWGKRVCFVYLVLIADLTTSLLLFHIQKGLRLVYKLLVYKPQ